MTELQISFSTFHITALVERFDGKAPNLWLHMDLKDIQPFIHGMADFQWNCVILAGHTWERDFSPWNTDLTLWGRSFSGGGREYLTRLTGEIMPAICEKCKLESNTHSIMGYSLAGLFSLFAAMESKCFSGAASVSGSLWYPNWHNYLLQASHFPQKAYLSVGDKEKKSRNEAFRSIEDNTRFTYDIMRERGTNAIFELNSGGHFNQPMERMLRAAQWLTAQKE
ncbi:MAG: hypothetical protein IJ074_03460 [Clostridia bacterium]|nr:hypothetical protein [Clostridia bacterium]MBQ8972123.1 hypothetical protein [Clostridia bacterium]